MAINRHIACCLCLRPIRPVSCLLSSCMRSQRHAHSVKQEKKVNVAPWLRKKIEQQKQASVVSESKQEDTDETPVIIKALQKAGKQNTDQKQMPKPKLLQKQFIESSLKDLKYDLDALKHTQKGAGTEADNVTLKSETGEIKVARDMLFGTPDPSVPSSDIPCGGCGALLHCQDTGIPGFVPQEQFKGQTKEDLHKQLCQRCTMLKDHDHLIHYGVDRQTYTQVIKKIRSEKALVVLVVDVTDMENSVIKEFLKTIGEYRPVYIVGNKIDLIPKDRKGYMNSVAVRLIETCLRANLSPKENNIRHVCLVSAKTGYGIEELVTKLMSDWEYRGNVYLVGTTNSGKSTLFNIFLQSDYCKSSVRDIVQRATVSQWPGTTLNLLKFPIINPKGWRLARRVERLKVTNRTAVEERGRRLEQFRKHGGLDKTIVRGLVEKTEFRDPEIVQEEERRKMPTGSTFAEYKFARGEEIEVRNRTPQEMTQAMQIVTDEDFPNSNWLFDTPGLINEDQVTTRLTADELRAVLPEKLLRPRLFLLKPSQVMFISGLTRIDCLEGPVDMNVCVFTNHQLPVHVVPVNEADEFYSTHIGTDVLGVPLGETERLNKLPSLAGREFSITNETNVKNATADIQLSSIGWISLLMRMGQSVHLRVYTPGGYGMHLRQPCLLPNVLVFRGHKIKNKPEYYMKKLIV